MGITSVSFLAGKQEAETLKWGQTSTHLGGLQIRKKLLPELSMRAPVSMLPTALCPCVVGEVWVGEDLAGTRGAIHCPGLVEGSHTFLPPPFQHWLSRRADRAWSGAEAGAGWGSDHFSFSLCVQFRSF